MNVDTRLVIVKLLNAYKDNLLIKCEQSQIDRMSKIIRIRTLL